MKPKQITWKPDVSYKTYGVIESPNGHAPETWLFTIIENREQCSVIPQTFLLGSTIEKPNLKEAKKHCQIEFNKFALSLMEQ